MKYPKQSKHGIPHFQCFACIGDSVTWTPKNNNQHRLTLTATLAEDTDTSPMDFDCYSRKKIKEWENSEWYYVGVVLSVSKNGVTLDDHAATLWGIDRNYSARSSLHMAQVCKDLEYEALQVGADVLANLTGKE